MIARLRITQCLDLSPKCCGLNALSEQIPLCGMEQGTAAHTPGFPSSYASAICF